MKLLNALLIIAATIGSPALVRASDAAKLQTGTPNEAPLPRSPGAGAQGAGGAAGAAQGRAPGALTGQTGTVIQRSPAGNSKWESPQAEMNFKAPWANSDVYRDCGMACLFEKGNENLALQGVYITNKMEAVHNLDPAKSEAELRELLGAFCGGSEDLGACKERYMRTQLQMMRQVRKAIAMNSNAAASFKNGGKFDNRQVPIFAILKGNEPERARRAQVAAAPTIAELQAQYERDTAKFREITSEDFNRWVDERRAYKPSPEDFIVTETIPRDPANPRAGTITRVKFDAYGSPLFDRAKFDAATAAFERRSDVTKRDYLVIQGQRRQPIPKDKAFSAFTGRNAQIYNESRREFVDAVNKQIRESGVATSRVPASRGGSGGGMQVTNSAAKPGPPPRNSEFPGSSSTNVSSVVRGPATGNEQILETRPSTQNTEDLHISLDLDNPAAGSFRQQLDGYSMKYEGGGGIPTGSQGAGGN